MKKQEAVNTFSDGLMLDLHPLSMPNTALTNCLNGTLLTYNGNENMLQNDMGNCRVETAMLPKGYIPLGSTSFGGIIYIVSYNPIEKKYLIGSFPSPERNLTKDELGDVTKTFIDLTKFEEESSENKDYNILDWFTDSNKNISNYYLKIELTKDSIFPGDKYKVFSDNLSNISDYLSSYDLKNSDYNINSYPKYLKLSIIAILDDGKIIDLTDNSIWTKNGKNFYYIYFGDILKNSDGTLDLDEYRGLVGSNYDTYSSKLSGKLGIAAKLEVPTLFSVGYDILINEINNQKEYNFRFYLNWANDNEGKNKDRINPAGIKCKIGNDIDIPILLCNDPDNLNKLVLSDALRGDIYYATKMPDDYYKSEDVFITYLTEAKNKFSTTERRANDGTDFQYIVKGPTLKKADEKDKWNYEYTNPINNNTIKGSIYLTNNTISLDIVPYMPFGKLLFLKRTLTIDLDKLQTGEINFHNYQYYVEDNNITMNFFLEVYPELGKKVDKVTLNLYPLKDNLNNSNWFKQEIYNNEGYSKINSLSKSVSVTEPFSGYKSISFDRRDLNTNAIYIAEFLVNYTGSRSMRYFHRLFFNSPLFNNAYKTNVDFKDLKLYSQDLNYGLIPSLAFSLSSVSKYDDSLVIKFPEYKELKTIETYTELYIVLHSIDSLFNINTNLENELTLNVDQPELLSQGLIEVNADDAITVEKKINSDEIFIDSKHLILKNNFKVSIPYIVNYADANSLPIYNFSSLKDGARLHRVILLHHSKEENEGWFTFFLNTSNSMNSEDNMRELYECADQSTNVTFNMDSIESSLKNIMNEFDYDYMTILFGIASMKDDNCGYGYKAFGSSVTELFYKLNKKPSDYFTKMTCIRKDGSVVLAHKSNLLLSQVGNVTHDDDYRYFENIINQNPTDGAIIPYLKTNSSNFKKYLDTGRKMVLYSIESIENIDRINNPSIDVTYNIVLKIPSVTVTISNINIPLITNETASNLYIDSLNEFNTQVLLNTVINNSDFINSYYMLDFSTKGWSEQNNSILLEEDISRVYDQNSNIIDDLIVKDGIVSLSNKFSEKCVPTQWFFGWEDTEGNRQSYISYREFKKSKQWYKVLYTYATPSFKATPPEIIKTIDYSLTCNDTTFIKGLPYTINITRTVTPDNFLPSTVNILCTGGTTQESFEDNASLTFSTSILVIPTESTCEVTLVLNNEQVGDTFIFENVTDLTPNE